LPAAMRFLFLIPERVHGLEWRVASLIQSQHQRIQRAAFLKRALAHAFLYSDETSGGTLNIMRHGALVRSLGAEALLMTPRGKDTHRRFSVVTLPLIAWRKRRPDDVCIIPEFCSELADDVEGPVVVYLQVPTHLRRNFDYMDPRVQLWTDSPFMLERSRETFPGKDIEIVPNIIDSQVFAFRPQSERQRGCIFAFPRKGPEFIEATRAAYARMGGSYWQFELISGLSLSELAYEMRRPQAFLASAEVEGCALPPQESMAAGIVVVGKSARGANFAMEHRRTAMVAETPEAAAESLIELEKEELRDAISRAGREYIARYFPDAEPTAFWNRKLSDFGFFSTNRGEAAMRKAAPAPARTSERPYIIFGSPLIGEDELAAVRRTLETCWIGTGPRVHEFQASFARYADARHALATGSCTAALHLSMVASGVGPGDEVITSPMTFCATANAIIHTGATPVFADCQRDTLNIDPVAIEAAITPRTKAILPIHFAGRPADMDAISALAERHGLFVIEDAAHAIESVYKGRKIGSISDFTCFSFYVTKNMTTGEGGMVTTNDPDLAKRIQVYGLHGMSADAWSRFSDAGYKHYDVVFPGFKYNLTDMAASLGLAQLPRVPTWLGRREEIWARYDEAFADLPLLLPAPAEPDTVHARHLYTVRLTDDAAVSRDQFLTEMHRRGIGTGVHYRALHVHPYYRERWGFRPEQFPNAYWTGERTVSLPLSPKLSEQDVERVIHATREILG
jgi:dTDP-4-amino-4,6-dideoxygalactose transaminase